MARIVSLIIFLVMLVGGLFFGVLNADVVKLNYYWGVSDIPLSLLMVLMLIVGAFSGVIASMFMVLKIRRQLASVRRQFRDQEKELENLRVIPLKNNR